jgi:hypothetical protein
MAMDVMSDIKALLTAVTADVYGEFPADKDNCIAINHVGGFNPEHTFGGGDSNLQKPAITHPSFQIAMRHLSEHTMHEWWDLVINALDGKTNYTPTGTSRTYLMIAQQGDVLDGGRDNNRRHIQYLTFNTDVINTR